MLLRQLGMPFETRDRRPVHAARRGGRSTSRATPTGACRCSRSIDGELIPESGAILLLPRRGHAVPADRPARPRPRAPVAVLRAEPGRAGDRGRALHGADRAGAEAPGGVRRPAAAGARARSSRSTAGSPTGPFIACDDYTVADIALHAYVHCARRRGRRAARVRRGSRAWLERVEATPGFVNDLAPIPGARRRAPGCGRRTRTASARTRPCPRA